MTDNEPAMKLELEGGREFEATRDNTSLFTFLGKLACYDHVFIQMGEEEEMMVGTYVFSTHPMYETMEEYMVTNDYLLHLNLPEVAQCDQDAFNRMINNDVESDLESGVPEEWTNDGTSEE